MNTFLTKLTITILIATTSSETFCTLQLSQLFSKPTPAQLQQKANTAKENARTAANTLKVSLKEHYEEQKRLAQNYTTENQNKVEIDTLIPTTDEGVATAAKKIINTIYAKYGNDGTVTPVLDNTEIEIQKNLAAYKKANAAAQKANAAAQKANAAAQKAQQKATNAQKQTRTVATRPEIAV